MSSKSTNNDFFNLNSESDSNSDTEKVSTSSTSDNKNDKTKKTDQWDWDDPQNYDRFYKTKNMDKDEENLKYQNNSQKRYISSVEPSNQNKYSRQFDHGKSAAATSSASYIEKAVNPSLINNESASSSRGSRLLYNLISHRASVNRVHWSKRYNNRNRLLSSSIDNKIVIWNLNELIQERRNNLIDDKYIKGDLIHEMTKVHTKAIRNAIWFDIDESAIASVSFDQTCALTNISTGETVNRLDCAEILTAVCAHPSDSYTVLIGSKNKVIAWDTRTNKPTFTYKSLMGQVQDIMFLNDEEFVVSGDVVSKESAQHSIMVWDFKSTAVLSQQIFHEKYVPTCLQKHPQNHTFYAQTHGNYIAQFSSRSPFPMNKHKRFESKNHSCHGYSIGMHINQHGTLLATGSTSGHACIYNLKTSKITNILNPFSNLLPVSQPCMDTKFNYSSHTNNNQTLLAVSGWNGDIKIYDI